MIKHIIWDFDGTLFDSYPLTVKAMHYALLKYNIKDSYENILQHLLVSEKTAINYYIDAYKLNSSFQEEFLKEKRGLDLSLIKPFPFALEICRKIKMQGRKNYIFTHRGSTALTILKDNNMIELFEEIITIDNGFKRKPDPEAVLYLFDKYNINSKEAMIVGDRKFEMVLGENANMKTCFYNSGKLKLDINPDYTINSLDEIINIINL